MRLRRLLWPYYVLKRWLKFQHQIYSIPKKDRPIFWVVHQEMLNAQAFMKFELGERTFGSLQAQIKPKELRGLEGIIN